jgi:Tfp pilus assembly protein PilN
MRAVNLLPEKSRPRHATGGKQGSSYFVLAGLGAVVLAVLIYVLTVNSINDSKTKIASAKAEASRANAQAQALGAYGDFAKVSKQREESVRQLAVGRFDWERLVRELAHVLPQGVWIENASAADSPADQPSGSGSSSAAAASSSTTGATGDNPQLTLQGCAVDQAQVAVTLVRLRELQGAEDVKLDHSTQPDDQSSGSGSGGNSATSGDCGTTGGKPNYGFQVDVSFSATHSADDKPGTVPARLGGGQ